MARVWQEIKYVGTGFMQDNGTIILNLKREIGHAVMRDELRFDPTSPHYQSVLEHLSPIRPGQRVSVMPWSPPGNV
jgi:hypothetical protein